MTFFINLVLITLFCLFISYYIEFNLKKIYSNCLNEKTREFNISEFKNGNEMWNNISYSNYSEICSLLKFMGLSKRNNRLYFNSIYGKYDIEYHDKYEKFPDRSYYRLSPKNYNRRDILFGTFDFQHFIYNHQHPFTCRNKKFLLIKGWDAGHISEIHILSSYLKLALDSNRIAIFDKNYKSKVANGKFCSNHPRNWECYLEPLSNCTLSSDDIKNSVKYKHINQLEKVIILDITSKYQHLVPHFIYKYFKYKKFSKQFFKYYWTIQSVTYLFRINKRTYNYLLNNNLQVKRIRKNNFINVWIRHGNKIHEMNLIPTPLYYSSINIYYKLWGKKRIYVSSDDPYAIETVAKKYNALYLSYPRINDSSPNNALAKGDKLTLNVIADILIALSSYGFSGTLKSNIARLLNELRMTVGFRLNAPFF